MTPEEIAREILMLTVRDLIRLDEILKDAGGGLIGVREPRRPSPESPGDAIANDLPEDYWETVE